ncbi:MAG: cytochrome c maturation protein CcmE [Burkholderiales bacterium]|jgi:cytochrome c-type biogenesis protein CcmE|nr:cytochrome c maturation protein CcmE [Burkholderiales bacterium]MCA3223347.1 cytochrome c maturation protein CcmE [Burkholderiales bacterium]MCA3226100.1 cytochrome c maturation protein CcmE [Burkholderiales bacterium]MCA3229736.1 cytochrome c maturation protein CcmE [Burkholderiales bacterium]MCE2645551.1 cytochrome c maturation protein CcmE [Burkholderiaceae bacterium]
MKPRHKRMALIAGGVAVLGVCTTLLLNAFNDNLVFFFSPSDVAAAKAPKDRTFRIGGVVEQGSVKRDGIMVSFRVTDTAHTVNVSYQGILPDLFREGQGVVANGKLGTDGVFRASEVLAKHDENYMPPEAAHAVEQAHKAAQSMKGGDTYGGKPAAYK